MVEATTLCETSGTEHGCSARAPVDRLPSAPAFTRDARSVQLDSDLRRASRAFQLRGREVPVDDLESTPDLLGSSA